MLVYKNIGKPKDNDAFTQEDRQRNCIFLVKIIFHKT